MEHTCMSAIYYDQGSDIKVKQCKTIVTFNTIPESKILDASNLLILSNLQKPWTIACKCKAQPRCALLGYPFVIWQPIRRPHLLERVYKPMRTPH